MKEMQNLPPVAPRTAKKRLTKSSSGKEVCWIKTLGKSTFPVQNKKTLLS